LILALNSSVFSSISISCVSRALKRILYQAALFRIWIFMLYRFSFRHMYAEWWNSFRSARPLATFNHHTIRNNCFMWFISTDRSILSMGSKIDSFGSQSFLMEWDKNGERISVLLIIRCECRNGDETCRNNMYQTSQ
jgi:hypothetical protein